MSRPLGAVVILAVLAGAAEAQHPEARSPAKLRALIARADAQVAGMQQERSLADAATAGQRAATRVSAGSLTAVFWAAVPGAISASLVRGADSILAAAGVVTPSFLRQRVFVMPRSADTAAVLAATDLTGRRRVPLEVFELRDLRSDSYGRITDAVGREFIASLDTLWRDWLQFGPELVRPRTDILARGVRGELTAPVYSVTERCLAGALAGCRLWLGLDADSAPFRSRYTAAELREIISRGYGRTAEVARCIQGDDEACVRVADSGANFSGVDESPATLNVRLSVLVGLRELHGAEAMRRALADTSGAIGDRVARAAGTDLDSFVLAWRRWLLAGGRAQHVQSGARDLVAALGAVAVLLFLSTRSGRWT